MKLNTKNFMKSSLNGLGAAFFCANPLSGFFFGLALLLLSVKTFFYVLTALVISTITAVILKRDEELVYSGVYGYNAALLGLYWTCFSPSGVQVWLGLAAASVMVFLVMEVFLNLFVYRRWNMPALSFPSLIVIWISCLAMGGMKIAWSDLQLTPAGFEDIFSYDWSSFQAVFIDWMYWSKALLKYMPAVLCFCAGILVHSRIMLATAISGAAAGLFLALFMGANDGFLWMDFYLITTTPIAAALCGFFIYLKKRTIVYTACAILFSAPVWYAAHKLLSESGLPIFTAPFAVVVFLFLLPLKLRPRTFQKVGLTPTPLILAASPEYVAKVRKDEEMGESFWDTIYLTEEERWWKLDMADKINKAVEILMNSSKIAAFTGAGISTESGIPDYRTEFLHWKKYDTSHFRYERFVRSEESRRYYWQMSQDFYLVIKQAEPNVAHLALAELEKMGKLKKIITQNVDRLHQKAGNKPENVLELHGNELTVRCLKCGKKYPRSVVYQWIINGMSVPYCLECQGLLKPASVAFGEPMPYETSKEAFRASLDCDLFLVIGSSLLVQPAALLPWKAKENGARLIIITLTPTQYDQQADLVFRQKAGDILPLLTERLKGMAHYYSTESRFSRND